jgi:hypothetical protein
MSDLNGYWEQYSTTTLSDVSDSSTQNCYIDYPDYRYVYYTYPPVQTRNKTEEAFNILKIMVEEKLVKEPTTFKKFCDLVEKIAKVI